jgi:hypothetical protein
MTTIGIDNPFPSPAIRYHLRVHGAVTVHMEAPAHGSGTDVTESFRVPVPPLLRATSFLGYLRKRRNMRDMRTTLERIKDVVEA